MDVGIFLWTIFCAASAATAAGSYPPHRSTAYGSGVCLSGLFLVALAYPLPGGWGFQAAFLILVGLAVLGLLASALFPSVATKQERFSQRLYDLGRWGGRIAFLVSLVALFVLILAFGHQ